MSAFKKIFGGGANNKGKPPKFKDPLEAIQTINDTKDTLQAKVEFLEKKIAMEIETAKKAGTKNKRVAIQALGRKKRMEKQVQLLDNQIMILENQIEALENASSNTEVLRVMESSANTLKEANNHMDVDKVHDMMDNIQEQREISDEISNAISNPANFGQMMDEDELEAELRALEDEDLERKLLDVGGGETVPKLPTASNDIDDNLKLPNAPVGELSAPAGAKKMNKKEQDDLDELQAWAS